MGQQQLLLIILGVIIVGIAVAVGITMFQDNAISANKDAVINDLIQISARAQQFFRKPTSMGGGGNKYTGLTTISQLVSPTFSDNDNGRYSVSTVGSDTLVAFRGTGKSQNSDGTFPQIIMTVSPTKNTLGVWASKPTLPAVQ